VDLFVFPFPFYCVGPPAPQQGRAPRPMAARQWPLERRRRGVRARGEARPSVPRGAGGPRLCEPEGRALSGRRGGVPRVVREVSEGSLVLGRPGTGERLSGTGAPGRGGESVPPRARGEPSRPSCLSQSGSAAAPVR